MKVSTSPLICITPRVYLPLMDILYLESCRNYTYLHLKSGQKQLLSSNLGEIEDNLSTFNFLRISRTHIINIHYLQRIYCHNDDYFARLTNGNDFAISRRRLKNILARP
jgi:two-component system LytT family response regulator